MSTSTHSSAGDTLLNANPRMETLNLRTLRVAIVGNTGVGKSTLVNVLVGKQVAKENNDVLPCTTKTEEYVVQERGTAYHILDTRGLNEGETVFTRIRRRMGILPGAERELKNLLRCKNPSINLVLFCIGAEKIVKAEHWKIYNKIHVDFCDKEPKVAVVVTRMGERKFRSNWKETCRNGARGVVDEFPAETLMEAVPEFEKLNERRVGDSRCRILTLIADACER